MRMVDEAVKYLVLSYGIVSFCLAFFGVSMFQPPINTFLFLFSILIEIFPIVITEPSYQNPPGTLYYPPSTQDSRQSIVYPTYGPNLNIPMIPSYHQELTQQQVQSQQALASEQVKEKEKSSICIQQSQ